MFIRAGYVPTLTVPGEIHQNVWVPSDNTKKPYLLEVWRKIHLPREYHDEAVRGGEERNKLRLSNTRGAGDGKDNPYFHKKGAFGEVALQFLLGRPPRVEVLKKLRGGSDFLDTNPQIEAKAGTSHCVEKVNFPSMRDVLFINFWKSDCYHEKEYWMIDRMAMGYHILAHKTEPKFTGPYARPGTDKKNWEIPHYITECLVWA